MRHILVSLVLSIMTVLPAQAAPKVVATLPVLGLLAQSVSDNLVLTVLVSENEDAHHAALTPKERLALARANLIIRAGTIEGGMDHVLSLERLQRKTIRLDQVIARAEGWADDQMASPDAQHFWFDPSLVAHAYGAIGAWLQADEPRLEAVDADLQALDQEIAALLRPYQGKAVVTLHDGFGRYLDRYGLVALAHAAHDHEAGMSAGDMSHLRHELENHPGSCLVSGLDMTPAILETLVAGTGAQAFQIDFTAARSETYAHMMRGLTNGLVDCFTP